MIVIGVDAGGTKTHTILSDGQKTIAEGKTGPGNHRVVGWETAIENITGGIEQVLLNQSIVLDNICIGSAGINSKEEARFAETLINQRLHNVQANVRVTNDALIALTSGSESSEGMVLVCGTGSIGYGHRQNQEAWVGGLDYKLSDEASGYAIGEKALHCAVKSMDKRIPTSMIESELCAKLKITNARQLQGKVYSPNWTKTDTGALAQLVFRCAEKDDSQAKTIISETIDEALLVVRSLVTTLQMTEAELVCVGGLFSETLYKRGFEEKLKIAYPNLKLVYPEKPPVWGAVNLALRM